MLTTAQYVLRDIAKPLTNTAFWKIMSGYRVHFASEVAGVTFTPILFQFFWIRVQKFFKFENPTFGLRLRSIQLGIYPCFYLRKDNSDSCYCRNLKVTLDSDQIFQKFLTPDSGPKEKLRILRSRLRHSESMANSASNSLDVISSDATKWWLIFCNNLYAQPQHVEQMLTIWQGASNMLF